MITKFFIYLFLILYILTLLDDVSILGLVIIRSLSTVVELLQNDLKRIIFYFTSSQLCYIIFVSRLFNYLVGTFYLMNHFFFKALFFLNAGSYYSYSSQRTKYAVANLKGSKRKK